MNVNHSSSAVESGNISSDVVCTQDNQSLRCNDCGDVFETIEILGAHRETVHFRLRRGRAPVLRKCDYCDDWFDSTASKAQHIGEKHPEKVEDNTTCTLCNKKLSSTLSYKEHMKRIHFHTTTMSEKKKPETASCDICGKVLSSANSLKTHMNNIHGGPTTNSIPCPLCPWKFRRRDLVLGHMRSTHKMSMAEYRNSLGSSDTTSTTAEKK